MQNPLSQKAKDNLLPGEKVPFRVDEGCEKVLFPGPHPPSKKVPTVPEDEGYSWDEGFCDFAFSSAQNDSISGDVGELHENIGRVQFCS